MRRSLLVLFAVLGCTGTGTTATTGSDRTDRAEGSSAPARVVEVDAGDFHTCARMADGTVECWGQCGRQCGVRPEGSTVRMPVAGVTDAVDLAVGDAHACIRTSTLYAECWGSNYRNLLGRESPDDSPLPLRVPEVSDAVDLAISDDLTCVRLQRGGVTCWGAAPQDHDTSADAAKLRMPTVIAGITDATSLRMTGAGGCAGTPGGTACWGWTSGSPDFRSRPGAATIDPRLADVVDATHDTCACTLGTDGVVHCQGSGILSAQLADGSSPPVQLHECPEDGLTGVRALEGDCALMQDGSVRCWNEQLVPDGRSHTPTAIEGIADAQALAVGASHACVLRGDGALLCWGRNAQGQVDGVATETRVWPPRVLAD